MKRILYLAMVTSIALVFLAVKQHADAIGKLAAPLPVHKAAKQPLRKKPRRRIPLLLNHRPSVPAMFRGPQLRRQRRSQSFNRRRKPSFSRHRSRKYNRRKPARATSIYPAIHSVQLSCQNKIARLSKSPRVRTCSNRAAAVSSIRRMPKEWAGCLTSRAKEDCPTSRVRAGCLIPKLKVACRTSAKAEQRPPSRICKRKTPVVHSTFQRKAIVVSLAPANCRTPRDLEKTTFPIGLVCPRTTKGKAYCLIINDPTGASFRTQNDRTAASFQTSNVPTTSF